MIDLEDLKTKKIAVLGLGVEGQAVCSYLKKHEIAFDVLDKKDGAEYLSKLSEYDLAFRSPGIRVLDPAIVEAQKSGTKITSQIKFFIESRPAKIIGVTGSKGKGTTSKLIYEILQRAGIKSYLAGNIGIPAIDLLDQIGSEDYVVLELSSFQLQDLRVSPTISVVLMVVPEHFDYHSGIEEYLDAKSNILRYQSSADSAVINFDYEGSMKIGKEGEAEKFYIQTLPKDKFESDPFKIYNPEDFLKIKNGIFAEELHGEVFLVEDGRLTKLMEMKDLPLRGFHNIQNIGAALMVAKILKIKDTDSFEAIKNYKGLEHRLEFVTERNRIKFYNDSIGTTPESSIAAIKAFTEPEIVIIGGVDKKVDYQSFARDLSKQKNLKATVLIGDIAERLQSYLVEGGYSGQILSGAENMSEIFTQVNKVAEPGDVVLLAPGTSSFGMFKDYKDRGNQFKELALKYE
jgi:UDP-N-acetylmuramoylalanine--D-glutamate ligase